MDRLIQEIRAAVDAHAYILSLQGALALIDICAALESPDGRTKKSLFQAWFRTHMGDSYSRLSAEDVYQMRCGILHQGRVASDQYSAILLTLPGTATILNAVIDDAYIHDLAYFLRDILDTVEEWWESNRDREPVRTNAESVVRIRPEGLPPYANDIALLA